MDNHPRPEQVLVIMAHPDDVEYFVGGTVARWTSAAVSPVASNRLYHSELLDEGLMPHHMRELWLALAVEPDFWVDITTASARFPHKMG